jgi:hypothetical protein
MSAGSSRSTKHDVVDGAPAARFVQRLVDLIESGYGLEEIRQGEVRQEAPAPDPVRVDIGGEPTRQSRDGN